MEFVRNSEFRTVGCVTSSVNDVSSRVLPMTYLVHSHQHWTEEPTCVSLELFPLQETHCLSKSAALGPWTACVPPLPRRPVLIRRSDIGWEKRCLPSPRSQDFSRDSNSTINSGLKSICVSFCFEFYMAVKSVLVDHSMPSFHLIWFSLNRRPSFIAIPW